MTEYNNILQQLTDIIVAKTKLSADLIVPELNLEASGLDSFARITLILEIEDAFDIELSDSESADIATIDDLIKTVQLKTA